MAYTTRLPYNHFMKNLRKERTTYNSDGTKTVRQVGIPVPLSQEDQQRFQQACAELPNNILKNKCYRHINRVAKPTDL